MNKFIAIVVLMAIACANAKPAIFPVAPIAYSSPLVAPAAAALPYVAATSSQVVSRNYNAAYVASPVIAASPYFAGAAASPYFAGAAASPYFAGAASPFAYASPYVASPVASPVYL